MNNVLILHYNMSNVIFRNDAGDRRRSSNHKDKSSLHITGFDRLEYS